MNNSEEKVENVEEIPHSQKKNKYNLTPEQVEALEDMSPKEKKQYFKKMKALDALARETENLGVEYK